MAVGAEIELRRDGERTYFVQTSEGFGLFDVRSVPDDKVRPVPAGLLAALQTIGLGAPGLATLANEALTKGDGLVVAFSPDIAEGLKTGAYRLLETKTGKMATAVDGANDFVGNARVVGDAARLAPGAVALATLPLAMAAAASYAQQVRLERALSSISDTVGRIETRLKDSDSGVCDAAERFIELAHLAQAGGGLPPYVRAELAAQRTAVEALYAARSRAMRRFKAELEVEQIKERATEHQQPWVDLVVDGAKSGQLEDDLVLYVRSLLARSRLNVMTSLVLAEEGASHAAMDLLARTEAELREEFMDLHRRLVPLARIAPEPGTLQQRIPGMRVALERAHRTVRELVERLNDDVLPVIPEPAADRVVSVVLGRADLEALGSA